MGKNDLRPRCRQGSEPFEQISSACVCAEASKRTNAGAIKVHVERLHHATVEHDCQVVQQLLGTPNGERRHRNFSASFYSLLLAESLTGNS